MKKSAIVAGLLLSVSMMVSALAQYETPIDTPENFVTAAVKYGRIKVADIDGKRQLCDERGDPIQLRGVSSFGLQWGDGDWILTDDVFDALAFDWNIDVIRLAMYVGEDGYADHPAELLEKVEKGINLAVRRGLYVVVDWHVLNPGDPTDPKYLSAGLDLPQYANIRRYHPEFTGPQLFFAYLSDKYGNLPNIIWEIANEPNNIDSDDPWGDVILPYSQGVVDVVRQYDRDGLRDNIVIVGTNNWSQFVDDPVSAPVQDANGQVVYAVHFYAGTHDAGYEDEESNWLRSKITTALNGGLAVFCSEWGTSLASGDGGPFIDFSERWLNFLDENKISWVSWSLARKNEISSSTLPNTSDHPIDTDGDGVKNWDWDTELSVTGRFVRAKIRGDETPLYTTEDGSQNNGDVQFATVSQETKTEPEESVPEAPETVAVETPVEEVPAEDDGVLRIGSIGPGGGVIYFIDGSIYKEVRQLPDGYTFDGAIKAAEDLVVNDCNDWIAPTIDELNVIYESGVIENGNFWSATESTPMNGWDMRFESGEQGDKGSKSTQRSALAIRSFVYGAPGIAEPPAEDEAAAEIAPKHPDIGAMGPGGGLIFFVDGDDYKEVRPLTGLYKWQDAQTAAEDLQVGGYNDWYAPSKDELNAIYVSGVIKNGNYWSATESSAMNAWDQNLENGYQGEKGSKQTEKSALAIRSYKKNAALIPTPEDGSLQIGSIGPGGGVIYYKSGDNYKEVRQLAGTYKWQAAKDAADNLIAASKDDWTAPSKDELNEVYQSGVIKSGNFWSATESSPLNGWDQRFESGDQGSRGSKQTEKSALAIRSFTYPEATPEPEPASQAQASEQALTIGSPGPGGGVVYAVNGNQYSEVAVLSGSFNWAGAKLQADTYNGGGFTWRAPVDADLTDIYNSKVITSGNFWSSNDTNLLNGHDIRFESGEIGTRGSKSTQRSALAIRTFTK